MTLDASCYWFDIPILHRQPLSAYSWRKAHERVGGFKISGMLLAGEFRGFPQKSRPRAGAFAPDRVTWQPSTTELNF